MQKKERKRERKRKRERYIPRMTSMEHIRAA